MGWDMGWNDSNSDSICVKRGNRFLLLGGLVASHLR